GSVKGATRSRPATIGQWAGGTGEKPPEGAARLFGMAGPESRVRSRASPAVRRSPSQERLVAHVGTRVQHTHVFDFDHVVIDLLLQVFRHTAGQQTVSRVLPGA